MQPEMFLMSDSNRGQSSMALILINPQITDISKLQSALTWWEYAEHAATLIVFIGVLGELLAGFTNCFRTKDNKSREKRVTLIFTVVLLIGLAGELTALVRTSKLTGNITEILRNDIAAAYQSAADANRRANENESSNLRLRTDLEHASAESRSKQAELRVEQRNTAEAQRQAAEAQLALKQHTEEIEKRQNWRLIANPEKFLRYLKGKPKRKVELLYNPNDTESYMFAVQIRDWLGAGYKGSGAGWDVAEPKAIPPVGGNERLANAPPQIRYGSMTGAGITFVLRAQPAPGSDDQAALQALMVALGSSIGLPAVILGEREDRTVPEGTIVVVIGQRQ
jgi:hypothetical protein